MSELKVMPMRHNLTSCLFVADVEGQGGRGHRDCRLPDPSQGTQGTGWKGLDCHVPGFRCVPQEGPQGHFVQALNNIFRWNRLTLMEVY